MGRSDLVDQFSFNVLNPQRSDPLEWVMVGENRWSGIEDYWIGEI